jgi:hypothetical protein
MVPEFSSLRRELQQVESRIQLEYEPKFRIAKASELKKLHRELKRKLWWERLKLKAKHIFVRGTIVR